MPLTWQGNFICRLTLFSLSLIAATCWAIIGKTSWSEKAMILSKSKIGLVYNHCWFAIYRNVLLSPQRSSTAFSARRPFKLRMEGLSTWICASWNLVQLPIQAAVNLWTFSYRLLNRGMIYPPYASHTNSFTMLFASLCTVSWSWNINPCYPTSVLQIGLSCKLWSWYERVNWLKL